MAKKKKLVPQSDSSSDEGTEQPFVFDDKKATKAAAEDKDEEEEEEEEEEEDDDDEDVDGTQRGMARDNAEKASSSDSTQAGHGYGASNSTSETSSSSEGNPVKPSHQFVVLPRKAENTNEHGKKTPTSGKPSKLHRVPETPSKETKEKASKRDRDAEPPEKASSKKQKKEISDKPSKVEKASKEKCPPLKKMDVKKSTRPDAMSENPKNAPPQQNSSKNTDNAPAKKVAEKSRSDKKTTKGTESEPLKGSSSPMKPRIFTPKDELVLTKEILHDIKQGVEIPVRKGDGYWSKLDDRVKGRMEGAWSKEQLCDKVRRMKVRYTAMAEKFKDSKKCKFRNATDKELFGLWEHIWGGSDTMHLDCEREVSEDKDRQPKVISPASPVKGGKVSANQVAPIQDVKIVLEQSEGTKSKHAKKQSSDDGDSDDSESEESDGEGYSPKKGVPVTSMDVDHKIVSSDFALVPKGNAVKGHENNSQLHSFSDAHKLFQEEIQAALTEMQESSKQTLKELQSKALSVVENAVKAFAGQSRYANGLGVRSFDGLFSPLSRGLDLTESPRAGDQALQQEWHELRLKELDVYHQKLELMQRECQLKQDQLQLQIHRKK